MSLTEEQRNQLDYEIERIRDIADYIQKNTNIKKYLIFDMANVIYLKGKLDE